jgi:hypothetical protein
MARAAQRRRKKQREIGRLIKAGEELERAYERLRVATEDVTKAQVRYYEVAKEQEKAE